MGNKLNSLMYTLKDLLNVKNNDEKSSTKTINLQLIIDILDKVKELVKDLKEKLLGSPF